MDYNKARIFVLLIFLCLISCQQDPFNDNDINNKTSDKYNSIDSSLYTNQQEADIKEGVILNIEEPIFNEDSCWRETKKVNTIDSYQDHISNFPKGKYYKKAKKAIRKLQQNKHFESETPIRHQTEFPIKNKTEGFKGSFTKFTDDRDGKTYNTVKIGDLQWFAENLRHQPKDGNYWSYDNNPYAAEVYGYLYDWETALNVCPRTWRLPEDKDWANLELAISKNNHSASSIKSTNNWKSSNPTLNNSTGFSAIPAGLRTEDGNFVSQNSVSFWWTATEVNRTQAFYRNITNTNNELYRYYNSKKAGYSVRCVK